MNIILCDFESVFTPEVWKNVAKKTGIAALNRTTKDEPDYDKLMKFRLEILKKNNIALKDIQDVIKELPLLPGAKEFLNWLQERCQVIILSDTFEEFAKPFLEKLGYPTMLCHHLTTDSEGMIIDCNLRIKDAKREAVKAFHQLNYKVISFGDSYNDISMLKEADKGILFCPPENVKLEYPQFPVTYNYDELKKLISESLQEK
jgi:phosphoserine/homoserine phosphotransferase